MEVVVSPVFKLLALVTPRNCWPRHAASRPRWAHARARLPSIAPQLAMPAVPIPSVLWPRPKHNPLCW